MRTETAERGSTHVSFTQYSFDVLVATLIVNSELEMSYHVHNVDQCIFECNCKSTNCFVVMLVQRSEGRIDPRLCRIPVIDACSRIEFDTVFITSETKNY